ncbi:tRNA3(Ser)-specific nuclease WapA precursor [Phycisphaerae bacterium RAS1]|nr:tRNA3(Ser)-specific nuclease WapA precursor [Phycisphaerae bacterium RAS1]
MNDPQEYETTYPGCTLVTADATNDGEVDVLDINPFVALLGAGGAGGRTLRWDAENRLAEVRPAVDDEDLPDESLRSEYAYDYLNRRVMKRVYTWDDGEDEWNLTLDRRYVYDGWRVLLELDGMNSNAIIRKYTWGLDLAGLNGAVNDRESAGGIGGMLAVYDTNGTTTGETPEADDLKYVYTYDANGNVGQLIDLAAGSAASSIKAHYEYDPYGGVVASSGTYAETNTYRFSTKPWDDETGLGYWGYRYYDARLGRWIARDPLGEVGRGHLYCYMWNNPHNGVDGLGRMPLAHNVTRRAEAPRHDDDSGHPCDSYCAGYYGTASLACRTGCLGGRAGVDCDVACSRVGLVPGGEVPGLVRICLAACRSQLPMPTPPRPDPTPPLPAPPLTPAPAPEPKSGCTSPPNGCTGVGPGPYDFTQCCNGHDKCYCTCGTPRHECDNDFLDCMVEHCRSSWPNVDDQRRCLFMAGLYYRGVRMFGSPFYDSAQDDACKCK